MMREAFMATPFRARAAGSCGRLTSSGTMAANTGQRMASPMPLGKGEGQQQRGRHAARDDGKGQHHGHGGHTQNCVAMK